MQAWIARAGLLADIFGVLLLASDLLPQHLLKRLDAGTRSLLSQFATLRVLSRIMWRRSDETSKPSMPRAPLLEGIGCAVLLALIIIAASLYPLVLRHSQSLRDWNDLRVHAIPSLFAWLRRQQAETLLWLVLATISVTAVMLWSAWSAKYKNHGRRRGFARAVDLASTTLALGVGTLLVPEVWLFLVGTYLAGLIVIVLSYGVMLPFRAAAHAVEVLGMQSEVRVAGLVIIVMGFLLQFLATF